MKRCTVRPSGTVTSRVACSRRRTKLNAVVELSAADEIHDFDAVAFIDGRAVERLALDHHQIVLDRDAAWVDAELLQESRDRHRSRELVRVAVQRNAQFFRRSF